MKTDEEILVKITELEDMLENSTGYTYRIPLRAAIRELKWVLE